MRSLIAVIGIFMGALFVSASVLPVNPSTGSEAAIADMKIKAMAFSKSCDVLQQTIGQLDNHDPAGVQRARSALKNCRYHYKQLEYFLEYYFISSAQFYNGPPRIGPEETELPEPMGFQVIEALLFAPNVDAQKDKLNEQIVQVCDAARNLPDLFYGFRTSDRQLLQSFRLELIRVMTLGITGYDAPKLKSGITEAYYALKAVQTGLSPLLKNKPHAKLTSFLSRTIAYLKSHPDFNNFDRMQFLTGYAMPLQQQLNLFSMDAKLEVNTNGIQSAVLNYRANTIFSRDVFNKEAFLDKSADNKAVIALGRRLFFENGLSGPGSRSCATCHQPERYFTDGLPKSLAIDGHSHVLRNAPTLLYAGFQHSQFWDARSQDLVEQVKNVLANKNEMAADTTVIIGRLRRNKLYVRLFKSAFPQSRNHIILLDNIARSIAAYEFSLSPRNSPFDQYMAGNKLALTANQIRGFNLFMGKARCGSCHFAPLFNGLVPPLYKTTELEIIGVPQTDDQKHALADSDEGRYRLFANKTNKGAFKTPTIRNVAKTGPYMHNGSFHTLEKVLDFYNTGGGSGWGINNSEQTLSPDSLKLNRKEIKAIISFLNSVTDRVE